MDEKWTALPSLPFSLSLTFPFKRNKEECQVLLITLLWDSLSALHPVSMVALWFSDDILWLAQVCLLVFGCQDKAPG